MKQGYTELTLSLLQKSPEAGHLLVQLHDKHMMYGLSKERRPEARAELASIMAELLDITLSPAESEMITDVLMSLMRQAENDLKRAVSERLAAMEVAPLRLIVHLANDSISVAAPVLKRSRVLDDTDLSYIVQSQSEDHWRAIAQRAQISDDLIDLLADTKDLETAIGLSENKNIRLTHHAMGVFLEMSETSEKLAKPLVMREELPRSLALKLYEFVSEELKVEIDSKFSATESYQFSEAMDDIVFEIATEDEEKYTPTEKMILAAEYLMRHDMLTTGGMIDNLRRGQVANFTAMFSVYCGLPIDVVKNLLVQKSAQGLAIACKATGILKPDFINMYLLTSKLRGDKIINHDRLDLALKYFDKIREPVAKHILNQSRH